MVSFSSDNDVKIKVQTTADNSGLEKTEAGLRGTGDQVDRAGDKFKKFGGIAATAGAAVAAAGAAAAAAGLTIGIKFNSSVEQAEAKLNAFIGDNTKVAETLAWVKDEAALTQFSFTDMADAAANLTPVSKSTNVALKDLIKQAEILAALNPAEGLTGATFSLREALSGDWVSIVDRFNLPRNRINELKAQGVPAMEIISKTLNEMGINYDLVSKQGKTVAGRFEQIKDKLSILAGAATKPVFDRLSKELENLGKLDLNELGEKLAGVTADAIVAFDQFIVKAQEVGRKIGDYLGPKFEALWKMIEEKVIPKLMRLWKEVIEPLIPVLGELLVGAIGLVIDTITNLIGFLDTAYQKFKEGDPLVRTLVVSFGALAAAMALTSGFSALNAGFTLLTTVTIPGVMAKVAAMQALIASPLAFGVIGIAAALAALYLIEEAANRARTAIDGMKRAQDANNQATETILRRNQEVQSSGVYSQETKNKFSQLAKDAAAQSMTYGGARASGGDVSAGVAYAVGDNRDGSWNKTTELFVPKQSGTIVSAPNVQKMVNGQNKKIEVTQNIYNQVDYSKGIAQLGFMLRAT